MKQTPGEAGTGGQWIGGWHAVQAALESTAPPQQILLQQGRKDKRAQSLLDQAKKRGVEVAVESRDELEQKLPGVRHQGVIARVPAQRLPGLELLEREPPRDALILVLDGVTDPHNLGACLRSAEAAGACAVIVPKDRSAGVNPTVRKVAAGAAERIPVLAVTNLARCLQELQARGYWVTGLAGEARDELYACRFDGPTVLVLGAEGQGMRRLTAQCCDALVKIPMRGQIESLNVSAAAAVCLFEVLRQRGAD